MKIGMRIAGLVALLLTLCSACTRAPAEAPSAPTGTPEPAPSPLATSTLGPALEPTVMVTAEPQGTPLPSPSATLIPVPPLSREALKNAAYPNDWPSDGVARLVDGEYREQYLPGSATELVILLSHLVVHGDLNGDGADDAVPILIANPGGSGTFYYLAAVLNRNGRPDPVASHSLGDRPVVRSLEIVAGDIVIELDTVGAGDSSCCPTDSKRLTFRLEQDQLVQSEEVDLPDPDVSARLDQPPRRIEFEPGATLATIEDTIGFNSIHNYLVRASAGQTMTVTVTTTHDDVWLSILGAEDGAVLVSIRSEVSSWVGQVATTQDYRIGAVGIGGETPYMLAIEIAGEADVLPTTTPQPAAEPTLHPTPPPPPAGAVVHLTFDDGPTGPSWTPQVLDVLARYDARATFFVLGQQAQRLPEIIQAEVAAGHTIANHTYDHHTLDGISRDAFFEEVHSTEAALATVGTRCLRPPYGATDAFTRAYAAELGYELVMWDIDTEDWRQPGADVIASRVLTQVFPSAVILFHDGGGDRSQTVEALGMILENLGGQGYTFEALCR